HLGEMVGAVLGDVGAPTLLGDAAIILGAAFLLERRPAELANASIVILAVLVADGGSAAPPGLGRRHRRRGGGLLGGVGRHTGVASRLGTPTVAVCSSARV